MFSVGNVPVGYIFDPLDLILYRDWDEAKVNLNKFLEIDLTGKTFEQLVTFSHQCHYLVDTGERLEEKFSNYSDETFQELNGIYRGRLGEVKQKYHQVRQLLKGNMVKKLYQQEIEENKVFLEDPLWSGLTRLAAYPLTNLGFVIQAQTLGVTLEELPEVNVEIPTLNGVNFQKVFLADSPPETFKEEYLNLLERKNVKITPEIEDAVEVLTVRLFKRHALTALINDYCDSYAFKALIESDDVTIISATSELRWFKASIIHTAWMLGQVKPFYTQARMGGKSASKLDKGTPVFYDPVLLEEGDDAAVIETAINLFKNATPDNAYAKLSKALEAARSI